MQDIYDLKLPEEASTGTVSLQACSVRARPESSRFHRGSIATQVAIVTVLVFIQFIFWWLS